MLFSVSVRREIRGNLATIRKLGYDAVTLAYPLLDGLSASGLREVAAVVQRAGLYVAAVRRDVAAKVLRAPGDVDRAIDEWRAALEAARAVGAAMVVSDLGVLPPGPRQPTAEPVEAVGGLLLPSAADVAKFGGEPTEPETRRPEHEAVVDQALEEAGVLTDRLGVPLAVGSTLSGSAALSRTLTAASGPLVEWELDPAALLPGDAAALLADHSDRLLHVRGRDVTLGDAGRGKPVPIGEGDVDWPATLALLRDAGYNGVFTVEGGASGLDLLRDQSQQ